MITPDKTRKVVCWGWDQFNQLTPPKELKRHARKTTLGYGHSCGTNDSGNVFCWGFNEYGQCLAFNNVRDVVVGVANTCVVYNQASEGKTGSEAEVGTSHSNLECHGLNDYKQNNVPKYLNNVEM